MKLVAEPVAHPGAEAALSAEPDPAEKQHGPSRPDGPVTGFTCPECSAAIWELREGELLRCRCRVGHSCSEDTMIEAQGTAVEAALWTALEVLEERGELLRRIAGRTEDTPKSQHRFREGAREADERASVIRRVLATGVPAEEESARRLRERETRTHEAAEATHRRAAELHEEHAEHEHEHEHDERRRRFSA